MTLEIERRRTLLLPSGSRSKPDLRHLFIVLTDISQKGEILLTSISSIKQGQHYDKTCELKVGEHSFIKVPSYVNYRTCCIELAEKLVKGAEKGIFIDKGLIGEEIFVYICKGLLESRHTPGKAKDFYRHIHDVGPR